MSEIQLNDDGRRQIMRIGNEVHRPAQSWTPAVHDLLNYLDSVGFKYAPKVIGFDDEGREVLSFIEGESGKAGWSKVISDKGLSKFAKLLRDYHQAIVGYKPSNQAEWAYSSGSPSSGEIMCHGDFGPWNIVWQGDEPIAILDWDFVLPAKPEYDILYALEYATPFRDDEDTLKWHHFPQVPDRKHRIEVFLAAYGTQSIEDIAPKVAELQRTVGKYEENLAKQGIQPQADWVANGDLDRIEKLAHWTETHSDLFE